MQDQIGIKMVFKLVEGLNGTYLNIRFYEEDGITGFPYRDVLVPLGQDVDLLKIFYDRK